MISQSKSIKKTARQKPVADLIGLLQKNAILKNAVEVSLQKTGLHGIKTLDQFYTYLDNVLTHIPTEKELMPSVREFYYFLSKSPNDILKKHSRFNTWMNEFVVSRASFMDTPASAGCLDTFIKDPKYKIDDYKIPEGGWKTYNEFLAREIKPGMRPIAQPTNENIIVSPADFDYCGDCPITSDSTVMAKGTLYSIASLIKGSKYKNKFRNGVFAHGFLLINDYHHFHSPVNGIIQEIQHIPASTWVHEKKTITGKIKNKDNVGFQFEHTRAYIILDSPVGWVAIIPVGMGHISSVNIVVNQTDHVRKGNKLGHFAFGGSDIIMLFEREIDFTAKKNKH